MGTNKTVLYNIGVLIKRGGGGGGTQHNLIQSYPYPFTIFHRKGTSFIYQLILIVL